MFLQHSVSKQVGFSYCESLSIWQPMHCLLDFLVTKFKYGHQAIREMPHVDADFGRSHCVVSLVTQSKQFGFG